MDHSTTIIDTVMHGLPGITGTFLLRGERTALVETGPKSSVDRVLAGLTDLSVDELDWIVVTHIHLDHAGAAGTLVRHFPMARVAVHEIGAPHLADPTKLWRSATRIYGDDMERLWGGIDPLDPDRIVTLKDGDKVDLGGRTLEAIETPGHAAHHHAFLDDATGALFAGDALGIRLVDVGMARPATPPPEFNLEQAIASIARIEDVAPSSVWLTHFGSSAEGPRPQPVAEVCDEAAEALVRWGGWVKEGRAASRQIDEVANLVARRARDDMEGRADADEIARMEQTSSARMNTLGYMRYFDKLEDH